MSVTQRRDSKSTAFVDYIIQILNEQFNFYETQNLSTNIYIFY